MRVRLSVTLALLIFVLTSGAARAAVIDLRSIDRPYEVARFASFFLDPTRDRDIDEIAHHATFGPAPKFDAHDLRDVVVWMRFAVRARPGDPTPWYLTTGVDCTSSDLYEPRADGTYVHRSFGWSVPFARHPSPRELSSVRLDAAAANGAPSYVRNQCPAKYVYYARIESSEFATAYWTNIYVPELFHIAIIAILAVLCVIFFALTAERIYLLSAAPLFIYASIFWFDYGQVGRIFAGVALPPHAPTLTSINIAFFFAQWAFIRQFLRLPQTQPQVDRAFFIALALLVATWIAGTLGPYDGSGYEALAEMVFYAIPIYGAIVAIRTGSRTARFFLAGISVLAVEVVYYSVLQFAGWSSPVGRWLGFVAQPFESLMLFAGIADRLRRSILDREHALAQTDAAKATLLAEQAGHIAAIERRNAAFARFVPREFLEQLDRSDIVDVRLGDSVERPMSVLFGDIRAFTTLTEALTPAQTFALLNEYFERASPIVTANGGFIDKYIGDAIMALFPRSPTDAVEAALTLHREVRRLNDVRARRGEIPLGVGIGINYGSVMLGTVGASDRFETTVLSDAVNVAARLEGLTRSYGAGIVAGEALVAALPDPSRYHVRPLGPVQLRGFTRYENAFEIFDGDPPELLLHKTRTLAAFETAAAAYRDGDFRTSYARFAEIVDDDPDDTAAAWLRDRSAVMCNADLQRQDGSSLRRSE